MNSLINFYNKYRTTIKFIISILILFIIFSNANFDELYSIFFDLNIFYLVSSLFFLIISIILSFVRWFLICNSFYKKFKFMESLSVSIKSFFLSQVLPSSFGGDVYKIIYAKRYNLSSKIMLKTIFIDRFLGFILMITFFIYSCLVYFEQPSIYKFIIILPTTVFFIIYRFFFIKKFFYSSINLKNFFYIFLNAFFAQFFTLLFFYTLLSSVSVTLTFFQITFVVTLSLFISMIPISVSGWGLREASLSYLMGIFFMLSAEGLVISIIYGISVVIVSSGLYLMNALIEK